MSKTKQLEWTTVQRTPNDLTEHPNNPRWLSDGAHRELTESLEKFGLAEIPAINTDDMILAGHQRIRILRETGKGDQPIDVRIPSRELAPDEVDEYLIRSNKNTGAWDWDRLANHFDAEALLEWGFSDEELYGNLPEEEDPDPHDDGHEMPDDDEIETQIQPGDLIKIGPHRLICGDSRSQTIWERLMGPQGKANAVMTDPPYNVAYQGSAGQMDNDDMSDADYAEFCTEAFTRMAERLEEGGAAYVWHADSEGHTIRRSYLRAGLDLKQCLIWVKNALVLGRSDYQWRHEPCLYGWKPGAAHHFTPERDKTTVINDPEFDPENLKKDALLELVKAFISEEPQTVIFHDKPSRNQNHPTIKPVGMIGELLLNSTQLGDLVIDGFLGSGTTMVAAHQTGRVCAGVELSPKYCQVIVDRMQQIHGLAAEIHSPKKKEK